MSFFVSIETVTECSFRVSYWHYSIFVIRESECNAIEEYRNQKRLHGKAPYPGVAEQFGVGCVTLKNLEQDKHRPLSTFITSN